MNFYQFIFFFTSVNACSSGFAVYELDEPVKTSNNNGLSWSADILYKKKKNLFTRKKKMFIIYPIPRKRNGKPAFFVCPVINSDAKRLSGLATINVC